MQTVRQPTATACRSAAEQAIEQMQHVIDQALYNRRDLRVLEAGCGSMSYVRFDASAHVTGIDISEKQLQRNQALHQRICADLQHHEFAAASFDLIVCWNVLEHLPRPEQALRSFARAVKPGGVVVLAMPNVLSLKGLVTKYTPHWLHVAMYKYLYGYALAGKDDNPPFPTFLRFAIARAAVCHLAASEGLIERSFTAYGSDLLQRKVVGFAYQRINTVMRAISFGRLGPSDLILVLGKL